MRDFSALPGWGAGSELHPRREAVTQTSDARSKSGLRHTSEERGNAIVIELQSQRDRFIEAARELERDDDKSGSWSGFKKIAKQKPEKAKR